MFRLILKSSDGHKTIIETPDNAYWALRARFICPDAYVRYENTGKNCAGFWPLPFKQVGITGPKESANLQP